MLCRTDYGSLASHTPQSQENRIGGGGTGECCYNDVMMTSIYFAADRSGGRVLL